MQAILEITLFLTPTDQVLGKGSFGEVFQVVHKAWSGWDPMDPCGDQKTYGEAFWHIHFFFEVFFGLLKRLKRSEIGLMHPGIKHSQAFFLPFFLSYLKGVTHLQFAQ